MESITGIIAEVEKRVNDLQRDNEGLKQTSFDVLTNNEKGNIQEKVDAVYLKPTYSHKIDGNKIKSLEDVIKIIGLMNIRLDDKAVKGLEHLIEKECESK